MTPSSTKADLRPVPFLEIAVMIGLPVAVIVAGAITTAVALQSGFTPIEPPAVQQPGMSPRDGRGG